jgi:citrate lyase beta subunit
MIGGDRHAARVGRPTAWRSFLSVPASNLRMVEKAFASDADAIILDLEDAVAPEAKAEARQNVVRGLKDFDRRGKAALCRVNALDTPYFYRDLIEIVEGSGENLDAILIPKVERPEDLYAVGTLLTQIELATGLERKRIKIEAQVESAGGLVNVDATVRASDRLGGVHFGPGDFAASLRMPQTSIGTMDEWDEAYPGHRFHYAMQRIVAAARAADLRAVDGPVADHRDEEVLRKSCLLARSLGFDGKWCIHPTQIAIVNDHFSPTDSEVEWAEKVVAAYEEANRTGSGAIGVEGKMVDAASIRMAWNTLDLARRS